MAESPDLKALREAAEKATQGDWGLSGVRVSHSYSAHSIYAGEKQETIAQVFFNTRTGEGFTDAKFIGLASPAAILSLLTRLDALEEALRPLASASDVVHVWNKVRQAHDVVAPPDTSRASVFNITYGDIRRASTLLKES